MRTAFALMVSKQWRTHVPTALVHREAGIPAFKFAKGRLIGEMYARACYSMLLVSRNGPKSLRIPVCASAILPQSRTMTIRLGSALLLGLGRLLPKAVHSRLLLISALMGMLDVVLDDAAFSGEAAARRVAALTALPTPAELLPAEEVIVALARAARQSETVWQTKYWDRVLQPAVRNYCLAEVLAAKQIPDPTGMGHRWAGIEAAIKGMWYATGPLLGLQVDLSRFETSEWTREQQWMANTSLLMQMIDDWVDQDEDRGTRLTPVITGDWTLETVRELFRKTVSDLNALLDANGIRKPIVKIIFTDLYVDYLQTAMNAMRTGAAA